MGYEYDDEGGTYWVPGGGQGPREEEDCPDCGQPGTVVAPWYNDETHPEWDTFQHKDPNLDVPEACATMAKITKGARI